MVDDVQSALRREIQALYNRQLMTQYYHVRHTFLAFLHTRVIFCKTSTSNELFYILVLGPALHPIYRSDMQCAVQLLVHVLISSLGLRPGLLLRSQLLQALWVHWKLRNLSKDLLHPVCHPDAHNIWSLCHPVCIESNSDLGMWWRQL